MVFGPTSLPMSAAARTARDSGESRRERLSAIADSLQKIPDVFGQNIPFGVWRYSWPEANGLRGLRGLLHPRQRMQRRWLRRKESLRRSYGWAGKFVEARNISGSSK